MLTRARLDFSRASGAVRRHCKISACLRTPENRATGLLAVALSRGVAARWSRMAGQRGHPGTSASARTARPASSCAAGWSPPSCRVDRRAQAGLWASLSCHAGTPQAGHLRRSKRVQYPRNCTTLCRSGSLGVRRGRWRRRPSVANGHRGAKALDGDAWMDRARNQFARAALSSFAEERA